MSSVTGFADERLPDGRQRVVCSGHLRREILTGIGPVEVEVPKLLGVYGAVSLFPGTALRSPQCES